MEGKIYTIKVTQKMCDKILKTNKNLRTRISGTNQMFFVHRNLHAADNGYLPFEINLVYVSDLIPARFKNSNRGLYKSNDVLEIPTSCKRFGIFENPTGRDWYTEFEIRENKYMDECDHVFYIKNGQAVLCQ